MKADNPDALKTGARKLLKAEGAYGNPVLCCYRCLSTKVSKRAAKMRSVEEYLTPCSASS